jgi:hypothetical protein
MGSLGCYDRGEGEPWRVFNSLRVGFLTSTEQLPETDKQAALKALQRMPESATLEQISEELAILAAIRGGEKAAGEGRVLTHAELKQRSATWTGK